MVFIKRLGDILGTVLCRLELMFQVDEIVLLKPLKNSTSIKSNLLKYVYFLSGSTWCFTAIDKVSFSSPLR